MFFRTEFLKRSSDENLNELKDTPFKLADMIEEFNTPINEDSIIKVARATEDDYKDIANLWYNMMMFYSDHQ